jgi:hypothetical protein
MFKALYTSVTEDVRGAVALFPSSRSVL